MSANAMRLILLWILLSLLLATGAGAQPQASAAAPRPSNAAVVAAALKALPSQHGLNEGERKQAEDLLHQAQEDESQADQVTQQTQSLRALADGPTRTR